VPGPFRPPVGGIYGGGGGVIIPGSGSGGGGGTGGGGGVILKPPGDYTAGGGLRGAWLGRLIGLRYQGPPQVFKKKRPDFGPNPQSTQIVSPDQMPMLAGLDQYNQLAGGRQGGSQIRATGDAGSNPYAFGNLSNLASAARAVRGIGAGGYRMGGVSQGYSDTAPTSDALRKLILARMGGI
jgi:hypothetical protein